MPALVDPEDVGDVLGAERIVECEVGLVKTVILAPHVEAEERGAPGHAIVEILIPRHASLAVGAPRAQVEHMQAGRIGGGEIPAPGFDGGIGAEVAKAYIERPKAAGGQPYQRPAAARGDGAKAGVDAPWQIAADGERPVLGSAPVEVLAIIPRIPRSLRRDHDRAVSA